MNENESTTLSATSECRSGMDSSMSVGHSDHDTASEACETDLVAANALPWPGDRYVDMARRDAYMEEYRQSITDSTYFLRKGREVLSWYEEPTSICTCAMNACTCTVSEVADRLVYFKDGTINACHNAIDRHCHGSGGSRTAMLFNTNDNTTITYTYAECRRAVCRLAHALRTLGMRTGDVACVYMPMCADVLFVALACARIGVVHNVVFGGYSKASVVARIVDSRAKVLVSVLEGERGGSVLNYCKVVSEVVEEGVVEKVLVVDRACGRDIKWNYTCDCTDCTGCDCTDCKDGQTDCVACKNGQTDCAACKDGQADHTNCKDCTDCKDGHAHTTGHTNCQCTADTHTAACGGTATDKQCGLCNCACRFRDVLARHAGRIHLFSTMHKHDWLPCVPVHAEHPLFILYTSGSTGRPKGIVHTTAGYLLHAYLSTMWCFNTTRESVFCCTADLGWITGHTYVLYGPLSMGMCTVVVGGLPTYPDVGRLWHVIEQCRVTHFYTAPTLIRLLHRVITENVGSNEAYTLPSLRHVSMRRHPLQYDTSSLRVLGSVGEPINRDTLVWYSRMFNNRPVVDCYWQTETGGVVMCPLANVCEEVGESVGMCFLGIRMFVVRAGRPCTSHSCVDNAQSCTDHSCMDHKCIDSEDGNAQSCTSMHSQCINSEDGNVRPCTSTHSQCINKEDAPFYYSTEIGQSLHKNGLTLARPGELGMIVYHGKWPGMARTILNDHARFLSTYIRTNTFLSGDEGILSRYLFVRGRMDDIINVSGHRISTAEVESACIACGASEVAMVGVPDSITGTCIILFVVGAVSESDVRTCLRRRIGAIIRPKRVYAVRELPKTRTGKIMRRVLRSVLMREDVGDVSTMVNADCMDGIREVIARNALTD